MPLATKMCATCDEEFEPASGRQRYCSECGRRGRSVCEQCGTEFKRKANTRGRFCSLACSAKALSNPETARRPCPICGNEFKPTFARQATCSRECGAAIQRRPPKSCIVCGTAFHGKTAYQQTCSYRCAGLYRRKPRNNCERCGKSIETRYREQRFCSVECRKTPIGTKKLTANGYVRVRVGAEYPSADERGYIFEHRYVIEQAIGRQLTEHETVHHKNGDPADNRLENLELRAGRHGRGATAAHCPTCTCFDH